MTDTLRERVAIAILFSDEPEAGKELRNWVWENHKEETRLSYLDEADAIISLIRAEVLEEAARVADAENSDWDDYPTFATGWASAAEKIAASIRALKEDGDEK